MNKTVLIAHVPYQVRGGEDVHIVRLIESYEQIGIKVILLPRHLVEHRNSFKKSIYSLLPYTSFTELDLFYAENKFDFIHLHNAFPFLGPRFLRWVETKKIPMLMTLHNHRFFCTNGLAVRNGKNCRECFKSKIPWRSMFYNCNSNLIKTIYHSIAMAEIRCGNLLDRSIGYFIAPSRYIEDLILQFGISREKVTFLLHHIHEINAQSGHKESIFDVIFAGRLSMEKGINILVDTAELLPDLRFAIVGEGPEAALIMNAQGRLSNISYFPNQTHEQTQQLIGRSKIGILPSLCNEILSLFALEVIIAGKRCVVSDSDSMQSLAVDGFPVRLSKQGSAFDFAQKIRETLAEEAISSEELSSIRLRLSSKRYEKQLEDIVNRLLSAN